MTHFRISHLGFTLLEMIGVLAITAIIAATITPNVVRQLNAANADAEAQTLDTLGGALVDYIEANKRIPGPPNADWSGSIAQMAAVPTALVLRNEKGFLRGYYVDPRFFTASAQAFSAYQQQHGLATAPVSPRIMLVSMLKSNAPGAPTTAAGFNDIWEQTNTPSIVESNDNHIERINLSDLFQQVVLINNLEVQPAYRIEGGPATSLALASAGGTLGLTRFIVRGSRLELVNDSGAQDRTVLIGGASSATYADSGGTGRWDLP